MKRGDEHDGYVRVETNATSVGLYPVVKPKIWQDGLICHYGVLSRTLGNEFSRQIAESYTIGAQIMTKG